MKGACSGPVDRRPGAPALASGRAPAGSVVEDRAVPAAREPASAPADARRPRHGRLKGRLERGDRGGDAEMHIPIACAARPNSRAAAGSAARRSAASTLVVLEALAGGLPVIATPVGLRARDRRRRRERIPRRARRARGGRADGAARDARGRRTRRMGSAARASPSSTTDGAAIAERYLELAEELRRRACTTAARRIRSHRGDG